MSFLQFLAVGTLATLSMMMFSSATKSSLYDDVVPRNLQFNQLSGINFLDCEHLFLVSELAEAVL